MKKRGLSAVLTNVILITVCLIVAGVVGMIIKNSFEEGVDEISIDQITLDLEISRVQVLNDTDIALTLKRNVGGGDLSGVAFVMYDKNSSEVIQMNISMEELEVRNYSIILHVINASLLDKISIAPIFKKRFGKDKLGIIQDEAPIVFGRVTSGSGGSSSSNTNTETNTGDQTENQEPFILETCWDETQNNNETGVDCGGPNCLVCADPSQIHYLVQDGVVLADIVISSNASSVSEFAAETFQYYINEMTGFNLSIRNFPGEEFDFHVYIGQSSYTDALGITSEGCRDGGFKMVSGDNYLVLLGEEGDLVVPGFDGVPGPSPGPTSERRYEEWDPLVQEKWGEPYLWENNYLVDYRRNYNSEYDLWSTDKKGTINAVYEFLYDQGMRFYHPGWKDDIEIGRITPNKENIEFVSVNKIVNPALNMRDLSLLSMSYDNFYSGGFGENYEDYFRWKLSLRLNSFNEYLGGGGISHGIDAILNRQEGTHPEFFAHKGETYYDLPNLCYPYDTDENTLFRQNLAYVKTLFDVYNVSMVNVVPSDGFGYISEECEGLATPERGNGGKYSDYVWEYVNNLAWEIANDPVYGEDKKILCSAYSTYEMPPTNLSQPLAPNLVVRISGMRSKYSSAFEWENYIERVNTWVDILPSGDLYRYTYYIDNWNVYGFQDIPVYLPKIIMDDLRFLNGKSKGEFIEVSTFSASTPYDSGNWNLDWDSFAANSLNVYLTARLYWDANQDVDQLLEEYYELYYGPAKEDMKAFINYSEENFADADDNPEIFYKMKEMLDNAKLKTVGYDPVYGERIDLLIGMMNSAYTAQEVYIDSCQNLDNLFGTYLLTEDVSSTGTCFDVLVNGITIDCQGNTINFGSGGSGVGVNADYNPQVHSIKIKNCNLVDGGFGGTGIVLYSSNDSIVENVVVNAGYEGIEISGNAINVSVYNSIINSVSGRAMDIQYVEDSRVENNFISSTGNVGLYLTHLRNFFVANNNISSDSSYGVRLMYGENVAFYDNIIHPGIYELSSTSVHEGNIIIP